jgi:thiopurine S-methyltransferase
VDHAFWRSRWQEGRTRFHEGKPNAYLSKHADWLSKSTRVLVPLCGKTEDLAFLAGRGHEVIGVELVEDAVRQFFAAHDATPAIAQRGGFAIYSAGAITVFAGDFFATTAELLGPVDAIYDRAALIALPPEMRARYVPHVRAVTPGATRELLVTLEYPAGSYNGPPFSVDDAEVRRWFADAKVTLVDEAVDPEPRGEGVWLERCYAISLSGER